MTLRSEIYFCTLKSSSRLGKGVADSANVLRTSESIMKDPKRSYEYQRTKQKRVVQDGLRLKRERESDEFFCSWSSIVVKVKAGTV